MNSQRRPSTRLRNRAVLSVVSAVGLVAMCSGLAGADSVPGQIDTCVGASGRVRALVAGRGQPVCTAKEVPLSWNAAGPPGDPGPQGDPGPPGAPGPASLAAAYDSGARGLHGINDPKGVRVNFLSLPAGRYLVFSSGIIELVGGGGGAPAAMTCVTKLDPDDGQVISQIDAAFSTQAQVVNHYTSTGS